MLNSEFAFQLRLSIYLLRMSITFSIKISEIIINIPYHLGHGGLIYAEKHNI